MKFKAILEELNKRKFKKDNSSFPQGGNSNVTIYKSRSNKIKETKYEKVMRDLEDQLGEFFSELQAYQIIEHVNKAFRAFGYKTDLLPIPHEVNWQVTKDKDGKPTLGIITSGFNNAKTLGGFTYNRESVKKHNPIEAKASFLNALIGNGDFHENNHIIQKASQQRYAIDFGYAFMRNDPQNLMHFPREDDKKVYRWQKYLTFWELYLEHNKNNLVHVMEDYTTKFIDKLIKVSDKMGKDFDLEEYKQAILSINDDNTKQLKNSIEEILNVVKKELKDSHARTKSRK